MVDVGEIGVGGGALGKSLPLGRGESSVSVSEDASSSQESAIVEVCCFGTFFLVLCDEEERERPPRDASTSGAVNCQYSASRVCKYAGALLPCRLRSATDILGLDERYRMVGMKGAKWGFLIED